MTQMTLHCEPLVHPANLQTLVLELQSLAWQPAELWQPKNRQPLNARPAESECAAEAAPLEKLPEGPWRSLGGFLDYSKWEDRERFLELDRAIQTRAGKDDDEEEIEARPQSLQPSRRCRAKWRTGRTATQPST